MSVEILISPTSDGKSNTEPSLATGSLASMASDGPPTSAVLAGAAALRHGGGGSSQHLLLDPHDLSAAGATAMRRRSILGPPSLFPSQRHQRHQSGDGIFVGTLGGGGGGGRTTSASKPPSTAGGGKERFDAEEVAVTIADLDFYYGLVKRQILRYQSPTTGLFPEMSNNKREASVRSSIYANMAIWSLYQAYKRIDDDRGKTYELGQSTVLGMRGILASWMRQSSRLEVFKTKQVPKNALHSKFNLDTGEELASVEEYNHLQIDGVSLYLLFLVQVISSGLQVVYDMHEFHFVQNLVYYVERAYRTPDFGMWERGSKHNNGTPEVSASSIGFAKAALEAVNGVNLFGENGAAWSVVYVDIDAHNRNRSIFETLLPRESASKDVDAALIPTVSFPAFATHDSGLYEATKNKVVRSLEGRYGFRRFSRDGYGTVLEPEDVTTYPEGKIQEFDGIESEWPMFYAFMIIDGIFHRKTEQVERYQELLKKRLAYNEQGDPVLPQYYYVEEEDLSRNRPSQHRTASNDGCSSSDLFLWAQSLLIISDLLTSQLLNVYELDPIRRHLPSHSRPKWGHRYSAFEVSSADLVVQVVTIAESIRLQSMLATYGIMTQTPNEIEPVQIWSQWQMVKVYEHLGRNTSLGLKGRPSRPIGSLGSSKIYRLCGQTVICYPLCMSASDFYLSHDMAHLTDDIKSELKFISRCWRLSGRPTVCILVTEGHMRDPQFPVLLRFLSELRSGSVDGVKIRLGRLQNLIASSCLEHLDFMHHVDMEDIMEEAGGLGKQRFRQLQNEHIGYQTLTDIPIQRPVVEEEVNFADEFRGRPSAEVASAVTSCTHLYGSIQLLGLLLDKEGGNFMVGDLSVTARLEILNRKAGALRHWAAVRYSSSLLKQMVDSISPFVTQILVNGKQVTVGTIGVDFSLFDSPMTPAEIKAALYTKVQPFNVIAAVLQQELILYCGKLIATNPELFAGMLKLRIGWILYALELYRKMKEGADDEEDRLRPSPSPSQSTATRPIESCSPSEVRRLLFRVLRETKALQLTYRDLDSKRVLESVEEADQDGGRQRLLSIAQVRLINGCLHRVPLHFYDDVWHILERSPGGIKVGRRHHITREPTLTKLTRTDSGFHHLVEEMLGNNYADDPVYKQLVVELFCVLAAILRRNPELEFTGAVVAEALIGDALDMFKADTGLPKEQDPKEAFCHQTVTTTSGFLARAVLNSILKGSILQQLQHDRRRTDYNCPVQ